MKELLIGVFICWSPAVLSSIMSTSQVWTLKPMFGVLLLNLFSDRLSYEKLVFSNVSLLMQQLVLA